MLYIFAGFPKSGLNANGLTHLMEVENLGILDNNPSIQYRKEGVFVVTEDGEEWLTSADVSISDVCLQEGITWDWFPENWSFGNNVSVHKTMASPDYKTVIDGTDLTLDQFLALNGSMYLANIKLLRRHIRHNGWLKYEARWMLGTCPDFNHEVILTWLVTTHKLPGFAYERLRDVIERGAEPVDRHLYSKETNKYFTASRKYDGKSAHGVTNALSML
jgi:hypothetical protein